MRRICISGIVFGVLFMGSGSVFGAICFADDLQRPHTFLNLVMEGIGSHLPQIQEICGKTTAENTWQITRHCERAVH